MRYVVVDVSTIWFLLLCVFLTTTTTMHGIHAFVMPSPLTTRTTRALWKPQHKQQLEPQQHKQEPTLPLTLLYSSSKRLGWESFLFTDMPSGEGQRKFRRTVYTHDDWKKHRSQDRFLYYLFAIWSSGVYKNLGREVTLVTSVAIFVCIYNAIVGGYVDFNGIVQPALIQSQYLPKLGLPLASFTLTSPSLGL